MNCKANEIWARFEDPNYYKESHRVSQNCLANISEDADLRFTAEEKSNLKEAAKIKAPF